VRDEITATLNIQIRVSSFVMWCRFVWKCQSFGGIEAIRYLLIRLNVIVSQKTIISGFFCFVELKVRYIKVFNSR